MVDRPGDARGALAFQPAYDGADEYELWPLPIIDVTWRERVFLHTEEGLGLNYWKNRDCRAGPSLTLDLGRDEADSSRLRGMGDVEEAIEGGLFWELFAVHWKVHADFRYSLGGGHDGLTSRVGLTYGLRTSGVTSLMLGGEALWASSGYMESYFGVSAAQADRSGLAAYSAGQGLKEWNAKLTLRHRFTPKWTGVGVVGVKRLTGDAAASPVVSDDAKMPLFGQIGVAYRF